MVADRRLWALGLQEVGAGRGRGWEGARSWVETGAAVQVGTRAGDQTEEGRAGAGAIPGLRLGLG